MSTHTTCLTCGASLGSDAQTQRLGYCSGTCARASIGACTCDRSGVPAPGKQPKEPSTHHATACPLYRASASTTEDHAVAAALVDAPRRVK